MWNSAYVTIGVPVYRGSLFIKETLESIQKQTYKSLKVVISVDGIDLESEEACKPFLKDTRFNLIVQTKRLGWVGNVNWLMSQADTAFWCCMPQDDLITSDYIEVLLDYALNTPQAAAIYCDIIPFGSIENKTRIVQESLIGNSFERQFQLLYQHHSAVAYRGLTRLEAIRLLGNIRENKVDSYSTDTVWMAGIARWGELHRIPVDMYHKRYHQNNEHTKWLTWDSEKLIKAWTIHCADMLEQAMLVNATTQERRLLWIASIDRLIASKFGYLHNDQINVKNQMKVVYEFLHYVQTSGYIKIPNLLNENWSSIKRWTKLTIKQLNRNTE